MFEPDQGTLPSLSVVIPTCWRRHQLPVVLAPLLADPLIKEVVVVVDGSDDGSIEMLREEAQSQERLIPVLRKSNGGAQIARADGLAKSRGEVVLFLDDDVMAAPGLAKGHLQYHARLRDLVVVGYMPVSLSGLRRPGEFATYLYSEDYERACKAYGEDNSVILRSLWAGNVSIRRADVVRMGMVSPGFEASYHADQDFGLRCLEAGLQGVFDRDLRAEHLYDRDLAGFVRDARSRGPSRVLLHRRHPQVFGPGPAGFEDEFPRPVARVVRMAGRSWPARVTALALSVVVRVAGKLHLYRIETDTGRLLGRVVERSAVWAALKRDEPDPPNLGSAR